MKDFNNINIQDINGGDSEDFYTTFRQRLADTEQFPSLYTFKFIIPTSEESIQKIEEIFSHPSSKIKIKDSKTGKYKSLTIETFVQTPDEVIAYYKQVAIIDKVIML